ncbi:MAG TPA: DUF1579 domain-containing protein [Planctomycetota bacterium]|jgi:hypothetical protein|nr:DUF1579 domain-containing protein [Planctomycetota bacterium]
MKPCPGTLSLLSLLVFPAAYVLAQDKAAPAMDPKMAAMVAEYKKAGAVTENHKLLEPLVGEWTTNSKMWMDPAAPPMDMTGTASAKSIFGGRFVQSEHRGMFMGEESIGIATTGYDSQKKKFVGTYIENGSTSITTVEGTYDAATKTFTFSGQYDDPMEHASIPFRFTQKVGDREKILFEWYEKRGGKEAKTMEIAYTRKK